MCISSLWVHPHVNYGLCIKVLRQNFYAKCNEKYNQLQLPAFVKTTARQASTRLRSDIGGTTARQASTTNNSELRRFHP
jgi:hypothetical protein